MPKETAPQEKFVLLPAQKYAIKTKSCKYFAREIVARPFPKEARGAPGWSYFLLAGLLFYWLP